MPITEKPEPTRNYGSSGGLRVAILDPTLPREVAPQ
jgi:hypothetical protein